MEQNNILVDKTLKKIMIADDRMAIKFITDDDKEIIATCDADCCSLTWIEDLINPEAAIGSEILKAEDIKLPAQFETATKTDNYEEEMQYYGFGIETTKGRFILAYRNSSNGYYGGWLNWPNEEYDRTYFGVHGQNKSSQKWKEIES